MRYYVTSDTHGFFQYLHKSLTEAGFFADKQPKKLILCGDMMDRGDQAVEMQSFMLDLLQKDELIFIRGNHEDLMRDFLRDFTAAKDRVGFLLGIGNHHLSNGTFSTACQLAEMEP
jgi:serine/threonine protein phosphatase 1